MKIRYNGNLRKNVRLYVQVIGLTIALLSCTIGPEQSQASSRVFPQSANKNNNAEKGFPESFEFGHKPAYAQGDIQLKTGLWRLNGALLGKTEKDKKADECSLRMATGGSLTMLFDILSPVKEVRFLNANFGDDEASKLSLWISTDSGMHWTQVGEETPVSEQVLSSQSFIVDADQPVRFSLHNDGDGRVNIDDFTVITKSGHDVSAAERTSTQNAAMRDDNMALGNPSNATTNKENSNNFLLVRPQYTLSYNNEKGMANWVSWHLNMAWRGTATRCNCFLQDESLPKSFKKVYNTDYRGSGFDRGHLCPSDDRTNSAEDNAATFLMTNMSPQSHELNTQPWEKLEEYERQLTAQGNEVYIIAGAYGSGGVNKEGKTWTTIGNGKVLVPSHFWKIIVVLPNGNDDIHRINAKTRVIAVDMPNTQTVKEKEWFAYRTSVADIEAKTGNNFFSKLPKAIAAALKSKVDSESFE
ncbi:MAG: DNA/RNA non-specific endonuclease [Chitinophagaceae bacterium]